MDNKPGEEIASEAPRTEDDARVIDLAKVADDADDKSDDDRPTTDHDDTGWRANSPSKP
jgi:hypothetical protein